ncbi:hypothetical protein FRB97_008391 [Tulasnella sp. 331]|nr:hypothetical protein FRB97_008391 [Tulasnella sp. 331]
MSPTPPPGFIYTQDLDFKINDGPLKVLNANGHWMLLSLTSNHSSASRIPLPPDDLDDHLADAFDEEDDDPAPAVFKPGHVSLHRESSLGTTAEIREAVKGRHADEEDEYDEGDVIEVDLNDEPRQDKELPTTTKDVSLDRAEGIARSLSALSIGRPPSTRPQSISSSYPVDAPSPFTPSIVVSRPPSPNEENEEDEDVQADNTSQFVNVNLSSSAAAIPSRAPSTSPRSIPRKIVIHPPGTHPNVQLVQGPPTPINGAPMGGHDITDHNGRRSESYSSPRSSNVSIHSLPGSPSSPGFNVGSPLPTPRTLKGRSKGISTLDVVSKTRPSHLPPKAKEEDVKHMKVWEDMMQKSREADELRQQKILEKRIARERAVEASAGRWEREVLPDWRAAIRDPKLKRLWWDGVPTKLRGRVWALTLGNALALSKDTYKSCLSRARRAITTNSFPTESMAQIEEDISRTLPALHLFHKETGPMYGDLKDLLCAWLVARSDEGLSYVRYTALSLVKGVSNVAAMFLINLPAEQAFIAMRNMLERHCMRSFVGGVGAKDDVLLHGENKAALEVARRSSSAGVDVGLGARYEQYGLTEEALWDRLESTEWKESTWSRLIQRELPDV